MTLLNQDLINVAIDTAQGNLQGNFSAATGSEKIREEMVKLFGTDKLDYRTFRKHKTEVFEFIEETVTPATHKKLEETFAKFAEFRSIPYGDQLKFDVPSSELFKVATIAEGSNSVRRKRLEGFDYTVETSAMAAGIYEELARFLAGRVDWAMYVQKLVDSFERDIAQRISAALYGSYDNLGDVYKATIAADSDTVQEEVMNVAAHVEAEHGNVIIVGTRKALSQLKPEYSSDAQNGERNNKGYFAVIEGYDALAMPQFHKSGTDEFAIDDNTILILPSPEEKLVKVVLEGTALVFETNGGESFREDMQVQYDVIQRAGVLVLNPRKYGMVELG